jgi:hypothetical protein
LHFSLIFPVRHEHSVDFSFRAVILSVSGARSYGDFTKAVTISLEAYVLQRVIHKSLRDFRPLRYSIRDGHVEGEHVIRGRETPSFWPTLQVLDMSTLGNATDVNVWQIPRHKKLSYSLSTPCFVTTAPSGETYKYASANRKKKT